MLFGCFGANSAFANSPSGNPATLCPFDGGKYGFLYEAPLLASKRKPADTQFACFFIRHVVFAYYDRHKRVRGDSMATIKVLQDTIRFNHVLHKGDTFLASGDSGEGGCDLRFRPTEPKIVPGDARYEQQSTTMDCVWLPGFSNHEKSVFQVERPLGPLDWYHLVDRSGHGIGWYQSSFYQVGKDIMFEPFPK
jgi:hypothetical protein